MTTAYLAREISLLRSFAVSIAGRDAEGEYNPAFARKMLRAAHERPSRHFVSAKSFLADLAKVRNG